MRDLPFRVIWLLTQNRASLISKQACPTAGESLTDLWSTKSGQGLRHPTNSYPGPKSTAGYVWLIPPWTSGYWFISEQDQLQRELAVISDRPANQPDASVLNLKITELLSFFQQHQANCPTLQMICPWVGMPLPSIPIHLDLSLGWNATLALSKELSIALMKYIGASGTTATKVSYWRGAKKYAALARIENNHNEASPLFRPCDYVVERTTGDSPRATIFPDKDSAHCRVHTLKIRSTSLRLVQNEIRSILDLYLAKNLLLQSYEFIYHIWSLLLQLPIILCNIVYRYDLILRHDPWKTVSQRCALPRQSRLKSDRVVDAETSEVR